MLNTTDKTQRFVPVRSDWPESEILPSIKPPRIESHKTQVRHGAVRDGNVISEMLSCHIRTHSGPDLEHQVSKCCGYLLGGRAAQSRGKGKNKDLERSKWDIVGASREASM